MYELGQREIHLAKYCTEFVVERCLFKDCKWFEPCKIDQFEQHLLDVCNSKEKLCVTCDLNIYKMYENDHFRENSFGHICNRDSLLFLWESLLEDEDDEEEEKKEEYVPHYLERQ